MRHICFFYIYILLLQQFNVQAQAVYPGTRTVQFAPRAAKTGVFCLCINISFLLTAFRNRKTSVKSRCRTGCITNVFAFYSKKGRRWPQESILCKKMEFDFYRFFLRPVIAEGKLHMVLHTFRYSNRPVLFQVQVCILIMVEQHRPKTKMFYFVGGFAVTRWL